MLSQTQLAPPPGGRQSQTLWQKALETLDDDLKASLDFKNTSKRNTLAAVLRTAREKKQEGPRSYRSVLLDEKNV